MKQIIRHGAYGIVIQGSKILLTQKKSGPYKGLWGLPGGAIEFGETPEETLKRELMEESCIKPTFRGLGCARIYFLKRGAKDL